MIAGNADGIAAARKWNSAFPAAAIFYSAIRMNL